MEYTALDPDQQQIRLLHVHPANVEVDLTCHFSTISLTDLSTEFEALSYFWGPSTKGHTICIEGISFGVTDSLWQALRSLRYPDRERIVWVDAVCINQSDFQERSHQVSRMQSIYSRAASVPICLGEPFDNIEPALQFFAEAASSVNVNRTATSFTRLGEFPDPDRHPCCENEQLTSDLVTALKTFMNRPWWKRAWTVAEFILAKKSTFHCGPYHVSSTTILQAYWNTTTDYQAFLALGFSASWLAGLSGLFRPLVQLLDLMTFETTFLRSVGMIRHREATDPRDKIYSMIGLSGPQNQAVLQPDYTLPVEKVYESFITSLLRETKNLHILSYTISHLSTNHRLPSWIPDWTIDLGQMEDLEVEARSVRCDLLELYNACAGTDVEFIVDSACGSLSVRGAIVDSIKEVESNDFTSDDPECYTRLVDVRQSIASVPARSEDPGLAKRRAFWLTMCAGVEFKAEQVMRLKPWENIDRKISVHDVAFRCNRDFDLKAYDAFEEAQRTFKPNDLEAMQRINASHVAHSVVCASERRLLANTGCWRTPKRDALDNSLRLQDRAMPLLC